jgi:hypothetical protein
LTTVRANGDTRLAVGAVALVHAALVMQSKERLDLADDLAARAVGVEHLIEEAEEGAPDGENPLPAVGALIGLGEQAWG